jgi:hypothetical protein
MGPLLETIRMEWTPFQVLRMANASLSNKAGVDLKVASGQKGYGLGLRLEVYMSSEGKQNGVTKNPMGP